MIVDDLKKSILLSAFKGNLSDRLGSDTDVETTLFEIQKEKQKFLNEHKMKNMKLFDVEKHEEPFMIPSHWKWVRWGILSNSIQYGVNAGALTKGNVKLVRISDIKDNEITWNTVPYSDINKNDVSQYLLNENDILFARTGGTVGKSVVVKNIPAGEKYVFAGYLIRSNYSNKVNYKYLKFFMESPLYWSQLKSGVIGSAQPNCNGQTLSKMIIPLPPIEEQQRIVDKIEKLFAKLDEVKPIEQELTELKSKFGNDMKNSILQSAYSGELCNSDYSNWDEDKFIKLMDIYTGNSISEAVKKNKYTGLNDGYNYIATKDLEFNHTFNYDNGIKIPFDETGFKYADKDSILMCIEGGSAGKKIGILDKKVCFGNKLCMFKPITGTINHKFIYYYLQSPLFLKNFNDNMTGIIGGVSINKLKKIKIKYPSLEEQQRIVDKIEQLLPLCDDIENLVSK